MKTTLLDLKKLKALEGNFLMQYPGGFDNPEIVKMGKKHRMDKLVEFAQSSFHEKAFANIHTTAENMVKLVSRASMVSLFEKPKYRDFVRVLSEDDKAFLVSALYQFLHGDQQYGFESMVDILRTEKLAKWSLVSAIGAYYRPTEEVFVKPTTAKDILRYFGITDLVYKPAPTWEFYRGYRQLINEGKRKLDKSLSPSNAAFSGFLMISMKTTPVSN